MCGCMCGGAACECSMCVGACVGVQHVSVACVGALCV